MTHLPSSACWFRSLQRAKRHTLHWEICVNFSALESDTHNATASGRYTGSITVEDESFHFPAERMSDASMGL